MEYIVITKVDMNDADYVDNWDLEWFYKHQNDKKFDGELYAQEYYSFTDDEMMFLLDILPNCEHGFHSLKSVKTMLKGEEEELLKN